MFCNTFGEGFLLLLLLLRVTVSSTASSHVFLDEEEHKNEIGIYLYSAELLIKGKKAPNISLFNQQVGIERAVFVAWYLIYVFCSFCEWMPSYIESHER